jgi:hypothetical protein
MHMHDTSGAGFDEYSHIDLSYAYNENLSFTLGLVVDDMDGQQADDAVFLVTLALPIDFK